LKPIAPVPSANDFLDIVLSKTQRKTPTVSHCQWQCLKKVPGALIKNPFNRSDIKRFPYSRRMVMPYIVSNSAILTLRQNLHPFLSSLLNVLYDKNHYKLALGQLNTARHLIDQIAKDYVRLLKFGDSLYRCKQLKKAALGRRMATVMKRQKDPLAYLEQVRQHISRLPTIDPNTRTLLVCGYPNVGKSSFVNKVTRADVDVQPYAFTTKSLFVGHLDYKYLRWQVIDTPGVLDHPLEEMNTIEMQSITALAHLRCACKLFHSIKPLFANKPTLLVINKIDVMRLEQLPAESRALVDQIINGDNIKVVQASCHTEEGVMNVRNTACEALLAQRVEAKLKGNKLNQVANRIHVAMPKPRDDIKREPFIPEAVLNRRKYDPNDPLRPKLEKDIEAEEGGPENWILSDPSWKEDAIPEIMDGKNVADFIDPDIAAKLEALEREEEKLEAEGFYDSDNSMTDSEDEREAEEMRVARAHKMVSQQKKKLKNRPILPRTVGLVTLSEMTEKLTKAGIDPS
ncbi:5499_t:CDS:2, partial [Acaulospora colombiana]